MSLSNFPDRIQLATSPFSPEVWEDPHRLEGVDRERAVEFADFWLTPATLKGFSTAAAGLLPRRERERLADAVARFKAVAAQIDRGTPATREKVLEALPAFVTILETLKEDLTDSESLAVRRAVWAALRPYQDMVVGFFLEFQENSSGEPSLWVRLILDDAEDVDVETREFQLKLYEVKSAIWDELDAVGVQRRLYVSVWGRKEVPDLLAWEPV